MNVLKCFVIAFLFSLVSCLSEKKAAGIKNAAIQDYESSHPCVSDTLVLTHTADTTLLLDTLYVESEPIIQHEYIDTSKPSVKIITRYITKTVTVKDSTKAITRDLKFEQRYKDSLQIAQNAATEWKIKAIENSSSASKYHLWLIIENILLAVIIALAIYFHFRYGFLKGAHI